MSEPVWVPIGAGPPADPGIEVAYAEVTTTVAVSGTTFASPTTILTAPAFTADGISDYLVEWFAPYVQPGTGTVYTTLWMDGVDLGILGYVYPPAGPMTQRSTRKIRPAAGSHVFSIRAALSGSGGSPMVGAGPGGSGGTYLPAFIRVSKIPSGVPIPVWTPQPVAVVTALPASPVDGQEIILVDSLTAPTYSWHLKFIAAKASNKWVFLGGSSLAAIVGADGVDQTTNAFSAADLATVGPGVTVPVAGLYRLWMSSRVSNSAGGNFTVTYYKVGAAAAVEIGRIQPGGAHIIFSQSRDLTALAGDLIKLQYAVAAGTGYWAYRQIQVEPIAVGG